MEVGGGREGNCNLDLGFRKRRGNRPEGGPCLQLAQWARQTEIVFLRAAAAAAVAARRK